MIIVAKMKLVKIEASQYDDLTEVTFRGYVPGRDQGQDEIVVMYSMSNGMFADERKELTFGATYELEIVPETRYA